MHRVESPQAGDAGIELMIQAKGKTAPRVTPADIEACIKREIYFTAGDGELGTAIKQLAALNRSQGGEGIVSAKGPDEGAPLTPVDLLTFCVLELQNGFTVTGESACASPENFDAEIGRKIARTNAVNKIWPLLGFVLRNNLANTSPVEA